MRYWMMSGLVGASLGAVVTASVFIVMDGAHGHEATDPNAATAGGSMTPAGDRGMSAATPGLTETEGPGESSTASPRARDSVQAMALKLMTPAQLQQQNRRLVSENEVLQVRIAELEQELEKAGASPKTYDLSPGELARMADRCELRWDIPSLTYQPPVLSNDDVAALSLTESERDSINSEFAASHARLVGQLHTVYSEFTGDTGGSISPEAMYAEIVDKVPPEELREIFQQIALERAGMAEPPADLAAVSSLEQLFRMLTSEGEALEQAIGETLGPELASNLRDLHGGWHSKFRSTRGCPQ